MPDFEGFFGRNVSYSKEKLTIYDKLQNDPLSPFKGRIMSEIFAYAAAFGFKKGRKEALRQAVPNISAAAFTDTQRAVLLSIAIQSEGNVDVLFYPGTVSKIINEYANGGIDIIESETDRRRERQGRRRDEDGICHEGRTRQAGRKG